MPRIRCALERPGNLRFHSMPSYGRGAGVGRGLGVGADLGVGVGLAVAVAVAVGVAVAVAVAVGVGLNVAVGVGLAVGVGVGEPDCAQYLPPVLRGSLPPSRPPQIIISLPVQAAVCETRPMGALVVLVAVQLSVSGSYLPPVFNALGLRSSATPDDHFTPSPDCRVTVSGSGRVAPDGCCPTIGDRIVSPTGVQIAAKVTSAPDDHFAAGPDRRMTESGTGALVMLVAVQVSVLGLYLPPVFKGVSLRPRQSFHCRSTLPCVGLEHRRVGGARGCPTVGLRIISAAGVEIADVDRSAPDDHFAAGPNCCVNGIGQWVRWWCSWLSNCRCSDCISRQCSK